MAQVVYGVQINRQRERQSNPAAIPFKRSERPRPNIVKICGANVSFVKKRNTSAPAPVEKPAQMPMIVENIVTEPEKPLETVAPVGWKAKRDKKKTPYGLKENPESPLE